MHLFSVMSAYRNLQYLVYASKLMFFTILFLHNQKLKLFLLDASIQSPASFHIHIFSLENEMDVRPYQLAQRRDFEFRFENQPFVVNEAVQNPLNVRIINLLHDRTLDALYEVHDKVEQALEVSQATFEALMSCEETSGDYKCLFDTEVHSNIFVEVCEGDAFLDKLKEFPSKVILQSKYSKNNAIYF